jgi:hypothetical protein
MHRRLQSGMWAMARQYYRYNRAMPLLYRRFAGHGMRRDTAEAKRRCGKIMSGLPKALRSRVDRGRWLLLAATQAGRLAGSARFLTWYP